ncbi:MAG: MjaI family restriction endonuclease [candidate division Zixibacteria bacterium]|nr:MjaI family restriction endonuclease [candidate division Zixibacteria bacterium]
MKIILSNAEIRKCIDLETPDFPKYASQLINLANQNAQGTRPKVVGQMSDLIKQFPGRTINEWEEWYIRKNPKAIQTATNKILEMVKSLKEVIGKVDREMVEKWVKDLVIVKTFLGLKFQEAILKRGAEIKGTSSRLADFTEESKGIDGYIGDIPVSIKPETYEIKKSLPEDIPVKIIYYKKIKNGIEVDYKEIF